MKILVFEYITGGGFNQAELPEALAHEGLMMLQALLDNLAELNFAEPFVLLDARVRTRISLPRHFQLFFVHSRMMPWFEFRKLVAECDAVWLVAPETGNILANLCLEVEQAGKILLTSSAKAVHLAGDKWQTYQLLHANNISTVETHLLSGFSCRSGEWILKPRDGVGGGNSFLITGEQDYSARTAGLDMSNYIIQPHLSGLKTSLSCLFKQGQAWLLTVNRQEFALIDKQYQLTGLTVNIEADHSMYETLIAKIAKAVPDLWGYVGIDLIEDEDKVYVLEINPRLTTSSAGIKAACGLNCAALVLQLLEADPKIQPTLNAPVKLMLNKDKESHAA